MKSLSLLNAAVIFLICVHFSRSFLVHIRSSLQKSPTKLNSSESSDILKKRLKVALTREKGANDKMKLLLPDLDCVELPCIQFAEGPDLSHLPTAIRNSDLIIVTSPQAAKVVLDCWKRSDFATPLRVATVGKGTSKSFTDINIRPIYEASEFNGESLASELPLHLGSELIYPCSLLADDKICEILTSRGKKVSRLYI